jgi:phosphoribosylformylglycinamidine cyclo-ligase
MPGVYESGEYDVAGFCVGVVDRAKMIDGSRVREDDVVVGLASSGVHSNGFSLVRAALGHARLLRFKDELLEPTRIYVKPVLGAAAKVPISAIAHVTGGGLARRLASLSAKRPGLQVRMEFGSWHVPEIFRQIQAAGRISQYEMYNTFNMGIGMALACRRRDATALLQWFSRQKLPAWVIGRIEPR